MLAELYLERGDELLDLFDKLLRYADSRARRRVDEQRRKTARQRDELATLARQLSRILVEAAATGELPMDRIEREIGLDRVHAAAALAEDALPPLDQQQLDVLLASHSYLRPAVLDLLAGLELDAAPTDRELLDAITATGRGARSKLLDGVRSRSCPRPGEPGCSRTAGCGVCATSSPCGSLSATPCAPDDCTDPSAAATPTPPAS